MSFRDQVLESSSITASVAVIGMMFGAFGAVVAIANNGASAISVQSRNEIVPPAVTVAPRDGRFIEATVTAYCPCAKCCGKYADGVTSRGKNAFKTRGVAVDPKVIPYGSMVTIPEVGTFEADDTGGAMRQATKRGHVHIDLRFSDHQEALNFGRRTCVIYVE